VKSTWTAEKKKDCIFLKQQAGKELGYNYEIWVYNGKGEKVKCLIDSEGYNPNERYSYFSLDVEDDNGNRASSAGVIINGGGVMITRFNHDSCVVREVLK
jgi:hypothetical protein